MGKSGGRPVRDSGRKTSTSRLLLRKQITEHAVGTVAASAGVVVPGFNSRMDPGVDHDAFYKIGFLCLAFAFFLLLFWFFGGEGGIAGCTSCCRFH